MQGFGSPWHLAGRFFASLAPIGPSKADEERALARLTPAEQQLFSRMSPADRRHAVRVAGDADRLLRDRLADGSHVPPSFAAAALMHDVGKVEARLGTIGRVAATLLALAAGRSRLVPWQHARARWRQRIGAYLAHDAVGAELLERAGSDGLVVAWAREHHLPASRWTLDPALAGCLKDADGD